jgi:hypothetical protein
MANDHNNQYSDPPFGMSAGIASTNAPGSAPPVAESGGGATVGTVTVTPPGGSSQVAWPQVSVQQGDTCGSAADSPTPVGGDLLTGVPQAFLQGTGAGEGSTGARNPNSMWNRS